MASVVPGMFPLGKKAMRQEYHWPSSSWPPRSRRYSSCSNESAAGGAAEAPSFPHISSSPASTWQIHDDEA